MDLFLFSVLCCLGYKPRELPPGVYALIAAVAAALVPVLLPGMPIEIGWFFAAAILCLAGMEIRAIVKDREERDTENQRAFEARQAEFTRTLNLLGLTIEGVYRQGRPAYSGSGGVFIDNPGEGAIRLAQEILDFLLTNPRNPIAQYDRAFRDRVALSRDRLTNLRQLSSDVLDQIVRDGITDARQIRIAATELIDLGIRFGRIP